MAYAACNIIGPDGELVKFCDPIPGDWPEELIEGLIATGGATESNEDAVTAWAAANAEMEPFTADVLRYLDATRSEWEH